MICENCGGVHDGSYGSGRFCSETCARSFSSKNCKSSKNAKISNTLKQNVQFVRCPFCDTEVNAYGIYTHEKHCKKNPNRIKSTGKQVSKGTKFVTLRDGTQLDCTYDQIEKYRQEHKKCEICGKTVEESVHYDGKFKSNNLCMDHDHKTNRFRGLLCQYCNRQLGWYEKHKDAIDAYLCKNT